MSETKLTDLQERVARIAAATPELSKTEIARRAGCGRRTVTGYFAEPGFVDFVERMRQELRPTPTAIAAGLPEEYRADVLKRVKRLRGTYLPELSRIETLMSAARDDLSTFRELFVTLRQGVFDLMNQFSGPEISRKVLDRNIEVCERALQEAGVDTSKQNPEMQPPQENLFVSPEELSS